MRELFDVLGVGLTDAAVQYGIDAKIIRRAAKTGRVRTAYVPGKKSKLYCRLDLEELVTTAELVGRVHIKEAVA